MGQGTQAFLRALALVYATPVGTVPAATVETEREVDDAIELARTTARFSLRSSVSLFRRCLNTKCRAARHGLMEAACLTLQNASLASDAGDPRPAHGIDGVPAVY